jgi:beta-galactosidase
VGALPCWRATPCTPAAFSGPLRDVLGLSIEEFRPFAAEQQATIDGPLVADARAATGAVWADAIRLEAAEPLATFTDGPTPHLPRPAASNGAQLID